MNKETEFDLIIEPGKANLEYWRDLWRYRELFGFLSWRDILVRYKQTVIGIAWAVIRPLLTMIVFTLIFGNLIGVPSGGVPYPILVFAAMLPWQFFASALSESSNSLLGNSGMVSKIYFPRLIIPGSSVVVCIVDFLITFVLLFFLMIVYRYQPDWHILLLPLFFMMMFMTAIGSGLWFAALNVKYRDFRYIVPFVVQFGLYVSPVGFSSDIVPDRWRLLYSMNPMVGVIDGFRWSILGGGTELYWPGFIISLGLVFLLFFSGIWYFRKTERVFADVI